VNASAPYYRDRLSLAELIATHERATPEAHYLEDARSNRFIDYRMLAQSTRLWRAQLRTLCPNTDAAIILDLADPLSFGVVYLAAIASGLRVIPVDPTAPWPEVARLAERVGTVCAVVSDRVDARSLPGATLFGVDSATGAPMPQGGPTASTLSAHAQTQTQTQSQAQTSDDDDAGSTATGSIILFTSGSTGRPKGVEMTEQQLLFVARGIAEHNSLTRSDRGYNPLPLFHVNAEVVGLLSTLVAGATLVLDDRFHRTGFWELLAERQITWLNAVPAILAVLSHAETIAPAPSLRFIRTASAPLPDSVRAAFAGVPLIVSWGMTEAASQITATAPGERAPLGSVGHPVGAEVQVRQETGALCAPGDVGSLWIRGPGIVQHYFQGAAADRFDSESWLDTNDLGMIDADGFVFLIGRADDVINRGGEKVYPQEVEDALLDDSRVREAIVVARPDRILGQVPVAYVIPVDDDPDDETIADLTHDLLEHCRRVLPKFKRPIEVSVVAQVPRAATGKVQRSRVREMAASALSAP
jgi:acyl-CoA synthetase (AMP-forming)/AMP-acid ligase II